MNTTSKTPTSGTAPAAPPSPLFPSASGSTAAPQDKNPLQTESCTAAPQSIQDQIHQPNSPIRHHAPIIHPAHGTPQDIGDIIARKLSALTLLLTAGALALDGAHAADYVGSGDASIDSGSWGSVYGLKGQPRTGNAQAEQARVSISGGTVSRSVYGGYARSDNGAALAGSNTVTISGMSGSAYSLYGGYARSEGGDASAASNSLSISGSPALGEYPQAVGGYAYSSNTIGGRVLSTNNRVNLNLDTEVPLDLIVGGRSMASTSPGTATGAYGNSITLTKGNVTTLYGGWSSGAGTADASGNTILISGGQVTYVVGGEAHSSTQEAIADGNTISITGGNHAHVIAGSVQSDQATASASDNAVYLRDTTVDSITGGYSTNAETAASLDGNSIVVDTGAVVLSDIHGGDSISTSSDNSASYNTIAVIGGGQVQGEIIGGYLESGSGSASQNTITISNSTVGGNISGGRSAQGGDVSSNSITIEQNAQVQGDIVGGEVQSGSGSASQNTLLVSNSTVEGNVYGGRSAQGGDVSSNSITIEQNAQVQGDIVGGEIQSGSASQNTLLVSNSTVGGNVYGGRSAQGGDVSSNSITIEQNAQVRGDIVGGEVQSGSGSASQNTLLVSNSTVEGNVYGGRSAQGGDVGSNSITIEQNAQVRGDIVGGEVQSGSGSASQNTLLVSNSTVEGNVYGGRSAQGGDVGSNSITIEQNAQVQGDIVGGEVQSGSGSASQNVVIVSNSKVEGSVCGGRAAGGGDASNNTIAIVGGSQVQGSLTGGEIGSGEASHNTIVVNNGSVHGDICGGRAAAGGSATGNSIILGQQARLSPTISLFGGVVGSEAVTPSGSGNTLFVDDWQGTVERAAGFANLHFVLPAPGTVEADIPMLTVSAAQTNDFNGTTVTAQLPEIITGGRAYLGETFELVHDNSGAIAKANAGSLVSLQQGYSTLYDGVILQDDTSVYIRIDDSRPNPKAGALTEARIGTAALLNQGGDLLAGTVLFTADTAARETRGWAVFATMYGGATDLTTESDITTRGMSLVTGLAHRRESTRTNVLVGAFFEMGFANLSTDRAIENTTISGSGDADYSGGGLFARVGITHGLMRGLYVEASGRVGEASTSWHSANLLDNLDRPAAYDLAMPYCGGHVGLGYALPINEKWAADFFSKYLFLYQDGCDTTINGEKFRFDSVNSARLRCGARVTGRVLPTASVYLGAAWEHEFRGKADATSLSSSIAIPSTSMQGDSAVFELGMRVQPKSVPVQFDCAIEGAAGTRESIGGRVQVMVEF